VRRTVLAPATRAAVDPDDFPRADERGRYRWLPLRNTNKKFNPTTARTLHYALHAHPTDGRVRVEPFAGSVEVWPVFGDGTSAVWRWSAARVTRDHADLVARRVKGPGGERLDVFQVDRLHAARTKKLRTIWTADEIGSTDDAARELDALVGPVFPTPKPLGLLRRVLDCLPDDVRVLDPFAGSGTTGQAVVEANATDGGSRRSLLVQAPEPTEAGGAAARRGLDTIAAITRARLAAAIERAGGAPPRALAWSDDDARDALLAVLDARG
jgi:adenine-specific DNA-methyltransferase